MASSVKDELGKPVRRTCLRATGPPDHRLSVPPTRRSLQWGRSHGVMRAALEVRTGTALHRPDLGTEVDITS